MATKRQRKNLSHTVAVVSAERSNFESNYTSRLAGKQYVNMADEQGLHIALLAIVASELDREENERKLRITRKRRCWIRDVNRRNKEQGDFVNLVQELRNDEEQFFVYFRMNQRTFDLLLSLVGPSLRRQDTHLRHSVSPGERLAITLRRLATGDSPQSVAFAYRRGLSTVRDIVYDTCEVLWRVLMPVYLKAPTTITEWQKIEQG